jgi:MFS family permease
VFAVATAALFLSAIDQTMVAVAIGAIRTDLGSSLVWSGWILTVYALGQVIMLPIAGALSDRLGRKRLFIVALGVFALSATVCAFAPNIYVLLAFRFIQALGTGTFLPSVTGVVTEHFGRGRDRALGLFSSIFWLGGAFGPLIGGVVVAALSWRWLFALSVPLCVVLLVLSLVYIPGGVSGVSGRIDVVGMTLLAFFLLAVMIGITQVGSTTNGLPDWIPVVALTAGIVLGGALVTWMRKAKDPFVAGWLVWGGGGFRSMNVINLLSGISSVAFTFLIPLYAIERFNLTAIETGVLLSGRAVGTICIAGIASFALRRTGIRMPMYVGFSALAIGSAAIALVPTGVSPEWWIGGAALLCGLGQGFAFPAANTAIIRLAPERASSISGLRSLFRQSGSIIAVSVVTAAAGAASDPAAALSIAFIVFAGLLLAAAGLAHNVPESRGSW